MDRSLFLPVPENRHDAEKRVMINSVGHFNHWIEKQKNVLNRRKELLLYPIPFSLHPTSRMRAFHRILEQAGWHVVEKKTQKNGQLIWVLKLPEAYLKGQKQRQRKLILSICIVSAVIVLLLLLFLQSTSS